MNEQNAAIKPYVIGLDLGGTNSVFGIVDARGEIKATTAIKTGGYEKVEDYVDACVEALQVIIEQVGGIDKIKAMGIGAPNGNYYNGTIEFAPNLPWARNGVVPLAKMFSERLNDIPVALTNDANAAAIGEMVYGVARGMKNFIVITLGTGVGSGIVVNGQLLYGHDGFAGELGHVTMVRGEEGRLCGCGRKGCLETYCSVRGLLTTIDELMAEADEPTLLSDLCQKDIASIAACCDRGDKLAIEAFRRVGDMLGLGLANYASILNPEAIILTGDMTAAGKWLLKPMRASFDEHVFQNIKNKTRILVSILKEGERDVLGASALAWDVKEYSLFK